MKIGLIKRLGVIVVAATAFFAYLFSDFVAATGTGLDALSVREAGAIVVLTGGKGRIDEGLSLLRNGTSKVLILSGVHEDAGMDSIFKRSGRLGSDERLNIILEKKSRSTYENAVEAGKIVEGLGLKSILLITSNYHMKRAHYTFRNVLPPHVDIAPLAVSSPNYDGERWWGGRSLSILLPEFLKYLWYVVRFNASGVFS